MAHVCTDFSFRIKGLRRYFLQVVLQDLTKFNGMAEEQCCMPNARHSSIRVGGYRVGSKPSHTGFSTSRCGIMIGLIR